ncbi:MAG: hypothetical protein HC918_01480 [Oscillatoriales cyanobacterium SM2_1_8]|nr:hypothetical protein [Oscillatoriales cyanobacterium SM2_1_8]
MENSAKNVEKKAGLGENSFYIPHPVEKLPDFSTGFSTGQKAGKGFGRGIAGGFPQFPQALLLLLSLKFN